jgi:uncharacterized protein (DUF433 family)
MDTKLIISTPTHLGGAPRIAGTRIPFAMILAALADGASLDDILEDFPGLTRKQLQDALREAADLIDETLAGTAG